MTDVIQLGTLAILIPAGCPDPATFETVIKKTLLKHFGEAELAVKCKDAWLQTQIVPQPFLANDTAADHYCEALIALSPQAQAWIAFEEDVNDQFNDYDEDGSDQTPAIPGWAPNWINLAG